MYTPVYTPSIGIWACERQHLCWGAPSRCMVPSSRHVMGGGRRNQWAFARGCLQPRSACVLCDPAGYAAEASTNTFLSAHASMCAHIPKHICFAGKYQTRYAKHSDVHGRTTSCISPPQAAADSARRHTIRCHMESQRRPLALVHTHLHMQAGR